MKLIQNISELTKLVLLYNVLSMMLKDVGEWTVTEYSMWSAGIGNMK